jgi:hypothetical protein
MHGLGTYPGAAASIRLRPPTSRTLTRIVVIALAVAATALGISAALTDGGLYSRTAIGAITLTGLLAAICPLALRARRASADRVDDGARIAAVAAAAIMVIGTVALVDHYGVAARFGDGTRGVIKLDSVECSGGCDWTGIFFVRQHLWPNLANSAVTMTSSSGQDLSRHYIPAISVGDPSQVYPLGGGPQWAYVRTAAVITTAAACSLIAAFLVLRYRRSRRHRRRGDGADEASAPV